MIGKRKTAYTAVFFQFNILSLLIGLLQTIAGVVARSTIQRLNASAFSDLSRNANAATISRLYCSTMFPSRQRVRRQICSLSKTPLLRIARIFAFTVEVNTPNKSAIWLCVSQISFAAGRTVTCPFSIVMGCVVIVGSVIKDLHCSAPRRVRVFGLRTIFLTVSDLRPPFCPLHGRRFEWSSAACVPSCG